MKRKTIVIWCKAMFKKPQFGFSLIEVLVALSIFAIALLGIADLQLQSLQRNQQAFKKSIAVEQLDKMRWFIQCRATNQNELINRWNQENREVLNEGQGEVVSRQTKTIINLIWRSNLSHDWYCKTTPKENRSCLSLEVS